MHHNHIAPTFGFLVREALDARYQEGQVTVITEVNVHFNPFTAGERRPARPQWQQQQWWAEPQQGRMCASLKCVCCEPGLVAVGTLAGTIPPLLKQ